MTKINGFEIASGFSVGGSGSNIASDIIFSPPEGMTSTNLQDAIVEAASMGGGSSSTFNPTKKIVVSATCSGIGGFRLIPGQISTAYAKGDGSDIRIQASDGNGNPTGDFLPIVIRPMGDLNGVFSYNVSWTDTIGTNETKGYVITYGDPAADFMFMTQAQLYPVMTIINASSNSVVYYDKTMAYVPPVEDWGVVGTQVLGGGDDSYGSFTPFVSPYIWNGVSCTTTINVNNNGAFGFGNPPAAGSAARGAYSPNSLGWMANDLYQNWVRQVPLPDGFYIQWDGRLYSGTAAIKLTLRYIIGGRWILTWFDTAVTGSQIMGAYIDTVNFPLTLNTPPTRGDINSYGVIVVDGGLIPTATAGPEEDI